MLYLLENHKSQYRLYCDNRKLISKNAGSKSLIFKEPFIRCNDFVIQNSKASWGSRTAWYFIVRTFDCTAETLSTNYPELFI